MWREVVRSEVVPTDLVAPAVLDAARQAAQTTDLAGPVAPDAQVVAFQVVERRFRRDRYAARVYLLPSE